MAKFDIDAVMVELEKHFHSVQTPIVDLIQIQTKDPFKVLVATILSARTRTRPQPKRQRCFRWCRLRMT